MNFILLATLIHLISAQATFSPCPLLQSYSIPPSLASIQQANLPSQFHDAFAKLVHDGGHPVYGNISSNTTSFSVVYFSGSSPSAESSIITEYHYTSSYDIAHNRSLVTADTKFPLAHVTMVLTVYAWLATMGDQWSAPITKYLPELKAQDGVFGVAWGDITVGALAGHMSGLPWSSNACRLNAECDAKSFFDNVNTQGPMFVPDSTPVISLTAFQVLAIAMERAQGQCNFSSILQTALFSPLSMRNTSLLGESKCAFRGLNQTQLGEPAAMSAVSTTNDLARLGHAILTSRLISPSSTRRWLSRSIDTSNLRNGVGYPWEIYRSGSTPISPIVQGLTKSGAIGPYASYFGISPDFNVGFALLARDYTAEDGQLDLNAYVDVVSESLGHLGRVAAKEMAVRYSGMFESQSGGRLSLNVSGLGVEVVSMSGGNEKTDIRSGVATRLHIKPERLDFRLYPTKVQDGKRHQFVAVFQDKDAPVDAGTPTCITWQDVGSVSGAPEKFVFELGEDGAAVGVTVRNGETYIKKR